MTATTTVDPLDPAGTRGAWGVLAVVSGALFLEGSDVAMLNVAVPSIADDIGLASASTHWVISAYVLGYAGFMILGGRVADLMGRRRVFLASLAMFVVVSALGGLAHDAWIVIMVRFVTGATAGFMTPAGFSILTTSFAEGPRRNRALAFYGAIGASGFLFGVVAGGLLTSAGWRWVFFAPALIGSAFLAAGWKVLPQGDQAVATESRRERLDLAGGITLTAAMVVLVYGVVTVGEDPGGSLGFVAVAVAAALFVAFFAVERRADDPLVPAGVLTTGLLPWATAIGMLFLGAFFAWQFLLTLYLQQHLGWGPLATGLAFAPMGVELFIATLLTPRLVARFGNVAVMNAGLVAVTLACAWTLRLDDSAGFFDLMPSLLLHGTAFALIYGPLTAASVEGVDEANHGVAGGIVYAGFQFGAAIGVSVVTIALLGAHDGVASSGDYQRALALPAIAAALALLVGLITARRRTVTMD